MSGFRSSQVEKETVKRCQDGKAESRAGPALRGGGEPWDGGGHESWGSADRLCHNPKSKPGVGIQSGLEAAVKSAAGIILET